jgi:hypothetical protein
MIHAKQSNQSCATPKIKALNDTNSFCNKTLQAQHVDEDKTIAIMKIAMDKKKSLVLVVIIATIVPIQQMH